MYCCLFDCVISLCREAYYLFEMDTSCMPLYFIVFVFFVGRYSISLEQIPDVWIHYDTQPWPSEYLIFNHSLYALYNASSVHFETNGTLFFDSLIWPSLTGWPWLFLRTVGGTPWITAKRRTSCGAKVQISLVCCMQLLTGTKFSLLYL